MTEDTELLQKFAGENSEAAFRAFVERRFDFVYAAALRQVGGDAHLARDVAQTVFLDAARKARLLARRPTALGWLYISTRFAAAAACRARLRRSHHEQKAQVVNELLTQPTRDEIDWAEIRPVIDQTLSELSEPDREAILLRYFSGESFSRIGSALGLPENSARMRVERALDKLRTRLARRGITSTAAALTAALIRQPVVSAPAGMAAAVAGTALAGVAAGGGGATLLLFFEFMTTTKIALTTLGLAAGLGLGGYWGWRQGSASAAATAPAVDAQISRLEKTVTELQGENRRLAAARAPAAVNSAVEPAGGKPAFTPLEKLQILAELQQKKFVKPSLTFVNRKGKVDETFVGLFALSESEATELQRALDDTREALAAIERARATMKEEPNGKIVVKVPPFLTEGGKLYDDMMATFTRVLGPQRDDVFRKIGAEQVENAMGRFGVAERTYTFQYDASQEARGSPYQFEDRVDHRLPNGGSSGFTNITSFRTYDEMVAAVGPVVAILPAGYRRK